MGEVSLHELFAYDPMTGILTWKQSRSARIKVGQIAGSLQITHKGKTYERRYLHVRVGGRFLMVHRVIYCLMIGQMPPKEMQIDHKNGDGTDNRWDNLRIASRSQNMMNRTRNRQRVRDLPKGVQWFARDKLYVARLGKWSRYFKELSAAKAAYDQEAAKQFGEFAKS